MRKVSVFIGRFQPFHRGHYRVVQDALAKTDFLVIVLGSDLKAPNTRDPLTTDERIEIIKASLTPEELERTRFVKVQDYVYSNTRWLAAVQTAVRSARLPFYADKQKYYLAGMEKDHTSFYLNLFPNWDSIAVPPVDNPLNVISSTTIREDEFINSIVSTDDRFVTEEACVQFVEFMANRQRLYYEYAYELDYVKNWGPGPHNTVDACVTQAGYVLLIQRGKEYGHSLWALPGGFINLNETLLEATIRELKEETQIKLQDRILRNRITKSKTYDAPYRSNRARIISHATLFELENVGKLPKVVGSDDAEDAKWVSISTFLGMREQMFEDHYDCILDLLDI